MTRLTALAVDDERPALEDLARLLRDHPRIETLELASSGAEALQAMAARPYDVLFLDVRMPGLDGVELARILRRFARPPALVFVTAHESAAVDAFELKAVDYLLKPVSRARIDQALERIAASGAPEPETAEDDVVPVDNLTGGGTRLLARASVLYLEAHGDYVRVISTDGRFLLRASLQDIERRWEPLGFARVHRRYVVNLRRAVELRPQLNGTALLRLQDGTEVPVARRQFPELRRRLRA